MKPNYIFILLFTFSFCIGNAQQDIQFSDYKLNMSSFNPAFAGFFDGSLLLIHRSQFVGFDGAPESQNLNFNLPINMYTGLGFNITNEKFGVTQEVILTSDYSYTIYLSDERILTFGLKAGLNVLNVDYSRLGIEDQDDVSFAENIENKVSPRAGIGFLLNFPDWYVGISTPNFLKTQYITASNNSSITAMPHLYFSTGYQTALTNELLFKPSILVKAVEKAPLAIDLAFNFEFDERFRFGASYRWKSAVTGILGFNVTQHFQIGYAYDYNINKLGQYVQGSHQFYLKHTFKDPKNVRRTCVCSFTDSPNDIGF